MNERNMQKKIDAKKSRKNKQSNGKIYKLADGEWEREKERH